MDSGAFSWGFAAAFLGLYIAVWTIGLVGTFSIYTLYSRRRYSEVPLLPQNLPGVSILRPLKGLDLHLEECLESAFCQDYPRLEILLSVAEEADPAAKVARDVMAKYPHIPARLIIGMTSCTNADFQAPRTLGRILK
jgi:ceramide glucosyltransferase